MDDQKIKRIVTRKDLLLEISNLL